ncbi:2-dehydro-3-deoxy-D-gluconate 5-dehydrogenase KduD [Microvirga sp. W0021]|uniref:2-dehydro-3-deoxy-D-gluconate 5-dehydrogenase KduD n=1 Tax=Hohaiivirga grylli TaxID=3133970 RepID=A0ABV0BGV9_9HYPH
MRMTTNPFNLSGKTALVTGADTGLGQGMALALAEAGANIVGVSIVSMDETAKLIEKTGQKFHGIQANLISQEPIDGIIAETLKHGPRIDILVNNAGIIRRNDAIDFSEQDWDDVININLKTVFFLSQAVARNMMADGKGGKIINIASMLSYQGGIRVPSYTASKSGVAGLTKLMANEWASKSINVNAIAPGYMATNNTQALRQDEARSSEILGRIPAARWGKPSDLGGAVVFLASAASDYVQGITLPVDGGWLAR